MITARPWVGKAAKSHTKLFNVPAAQPSNNSAKSHMTGRYGAGRCTQCCKSYYLLLQIVAARSQLGLLSSWVQEEKKDKITHMHTQLKAEKLLTFYKLFTELSTWILQQPSNLQTGWLEVEKCKLCTFLLPFRPWSLCVCFAWSKTPLLSLLPFYGCGIPWSLYMLHNNCKTTVMFLLLLWRCGVPSPCVCYCKATLAILWSLWLNLVLN